MRALLCKSLDGPAALELADLPDPIAAKGQVIVAVRAAALNFFDTLITRGKYQHKPDLPFSPSGEIAGVVEAVGEGVSGLVPGDRVAAYLGWGGAREKISVAAEHLVHIPDGVNFQTASGVAITYGTALHGLRDRAKVRSGETVAVLGASGGAGLAAVEIAKLLGARVIAVASSPEKLEICRQHGADETLCYADTDLKTGLRELTNGIGVDVVYDCVGGPYAEPAIRAMAWEGRFLVVGFAAGEIPRLPLNLLLLKGCAALGVFWGEAVKRDVTRHRENLSQLLRWVADGNLEPRIGAVFPLERGVEALQLIDQRKAAGKIILEI
ncbi:NADPH:quinone oxidoreductase [Candidatus Filomicrobium marinum]|uniref:NADPH:quinone oxidoreductase n=1 Tax=Candidatus Filomicrobium marinum TaxID=1608628 RepID=A0A0D6JDF1_9HYPH|nr:NADPH:quinone oxidoreductase family protein [Candidatus Filomicrobium marinum]CFX09991.1 NADPH:quinone oxidoreductase [Candidatus Filomicrobium marinum]CPR17046.1 NADPH:quinone oxidoreductase [Candidatus Filomicrobium marinum]